MKKNKKKKKIIIAAIVLPFLFILSYGAIRAGVFVGNFLFSVNSGYLRNIDTNNFKYALNLSYPLMNMVYNSGNIDVSIVGEIEKLVGDIFGFELGSPVTIMNAQSPSLRRYYYYTYLPDQAEKMKRQAQAEETPGDTGTGDEGKDQQTPPPTTPETTRDDDDKNDTGQPGTDKEPASSIFYEGESEEKSPRTNIIEKGKIKIQSEKDLKIDIDKLLAEPLKFDLKKKGPKVLIYHTHTTESYLKSAAEVDKKGVSSWDSDPKKNVVKVGDELAVQLKKKYGVEVLHNGTVHNIPDQNKAYVASLATLNSYLKSYPSIQITIDLHRDAKGNGDDKLRIPVKVNGKNAAQIMFVLGSNHTNWKENLKLALRMQQKANELYPGLAKPIWIADGKRYNQHLRYGSFTVEVGGDGNTLSEAVESARCLAVIIGEVMKEIK